MPPLLHFDKGEGGTPAPIAYAAGCDQLVCCVSPHASHRVG
jgi:hypothetical protein